MGYRCLAVGRLAMRLAVGIDVVCRSIGVLKTGLRLRLENGAFR